MFELGTAAGLRHPFSKKETLANGREVPLDVTLQDANPETEVLVPEHLHYIKRQQRDSLDRLMWEDSYHTKPMLETVPFPALHYAHVDLAKNRDAAALVVLHVVDTKKCERMDEKTLQVVSETLPVMRVDLALRIVPPAHGEIDIPKIRAILHQLRNKVGMQFGLVTFDQYQSQESVKSLKDAGFTAGNFSVDNDSEAYDQLKQALYDERVLCYEFPKLEHELAQLERAGNKVDHPAQAGSSKDLADCLAAVVHHAEEGWRSGAGSLNLFQLGSMETSGQTVKTESLAERAYRKIIDGPGLLALTPEEEDFLVFGGP